MTKNENSPENLRKFLLSKDPAMRLMGISMAKGVDLTESNKLVMALSLWDSDEKIKDSADKFVEQKGSEVNTIIVNRGEESGMHIEIDTEIIILLLGSAIFEEYSSGNTEIYRDEKIRNIYAEIENYLYYEIKKLKQTNSKKIISDLVDCLYNQWEQNYTYEKYGKTKELWNVAELAGFVIELESFLSPKKLPRKLAIVSDSNQITINTFRDYGSGDVRVIRAIPLVGYYSIISEFGSKEDIEIVTSCMIAMLLNDYNSGQYEEVIDILLDYSGMTETDILEYINENSDDPECPNCWDGSKVKGPDDYGEYWCTNSDCDEENYFTKIPTELKELLE